MAGKHERPVAVIIPHGGGEAQREVQQIMWVLTEDGALVNLNACAFVACQWSGEEDEAPLVVAFEPQRDNYEANGHTLCSCDDKAHGKRIITDLATYIAQGVSVIDMHQVKHRGTDPLFGIPPRCETCGKEATRVVEGRYACAEHDGKRTLNEAFPEEGEAS